jgi:hypothetical protein
MRFAQKNKVAVAGMPPIKGRTMMTEGSWNLQTRKF